MKMDPEWKQKWLAALRSGEYKQGQGQLVQQHSDGAVVYCCLGVLCAITKPHLISIRDGGINYPAVAEELGAGPDEEIANTYLPFPVLTQVGLPTEGNEVCTTQMDLAEKNDRGATFPEIADWIERNL